MSKREEGEVNITQRGCKLNSIPTETFNLKRAAEREPEHTRAAMAITGDIPTVLQRTWGASRLQRSCVSTSEKLFETLMRSQ